MVVFTEPPDETPLDRVVLSIGRDLQDAVESLNYALAEMVDTHRRMDRIEMMVYSGMAVIVVLAGVGVVAFVVKGLMR